MKILILGATGKVGRLLVAQALAEGHEVTAFVRDPARLAVSHPGLTPFVGDARDASLVAAAMAGRDAVLSTLGHNSVRSSDVLTAATRAVLANITPAQRFISLTGEGALHDLHDPPAWLGGRIINFLIRLIPGRIFSDAVEHAQLLRHSQANWVLVRSPRMINGAPTSNYHTGFFPVGFSTHAVRADVADFMLRCTTTDTWLRQAPLIASRSRPKSKSGAKPQAGV